MVEPVKLDASVTDASDAAVRTLTSDRERDVRLAESRQGSLDKARDERLASENRELVPLEQRATALEGELQGLKPPTPTELPEWKPHPAIDPKDFQNLGVALLAMAAIGGIASKGNWMGVSASLNGAMKGYIKGNKERSDKEFQDYQTKFNEALKKDQQTQREFENILTNKNLSINSILSQIKIAAAKYGREDIRQAAEQKSIDSIWRQVEATDRSIAQVETQHERLAIQLALGNAHLQQATGGLSTLNDDGKWLVTQMAVGGNWKPLDEVRSRFGGVVAASIMNDIGMMFHQANIDPRTITEAQYSNMVQKAVQQNLSIRLSRIESLTGTMQKVEPEIQAVTAKINGYNPQFLNKAFNSFTSGTFGSEDIKELEILAADFGRQFVEATTMPGSNAQMHATSQEFARKVTDRDFNLNSLAGALKAINFIIASETKSIQQQIKDSGSVVTGQGPTIAPPGSPTPGIVSPQQGQVVDWNTL